MTKNAVATAESTAVAAFDDETAFDTGDNGFENVTSSDILIPRITILQKLSPQLSKGDPLYIPEAEAGDICDVATGQVFKEMVVVPCYYAMNYLEWHNQRGKGLVANHGTNAAVLKNTTQDEKRRNVLPSGNIIQETAQFYVINLSADGRRSFVPMVSTGLKHARKWLTLLTTRKLQRKDGSSFTAPLWFSSWVLTTVEERNDMGSWYSFKFTPGDSILKLDPSKGLLNEAMAFHQQIADGAARGDIANDSEEAAKADIPF